MNRQFGAMALVVLMAAGLAKAAEGNWDWQEATPESQGMSSTALKTVWEFSTKNDLPAACRFSSAPQTCTRLANGNTIFTSRGDSNGKGPQLVEVSPDKKVVWVLQDWKTLGRATTVQILDDPGIPENPGESEH